MSRSNHNIILNKIQQLTENFHKNLSQENKIQDTQILEFYIKLLKKEFW